MSDYFADMGPEVDTAFVVHGEEDAASEMAADLRRLGAGRVVLPSEGESYSA